MKNKVISVILALWLLLLPFYLLSAFSPVYDFLYKRTHNYQVGSLTKESIDSVTEGIISYLHGKRENLYISVEGKSLFQTQEIFHMWEVKRIFLFMKKMLFISTLGLVLYFLISRNFKSLKGQFYALLGVLGLSVLGAFFFDQAFILMHKVVFNNDYWMFSYDSPLISILEENFFLYFFLLSIGSSFILSLVLWVIGRRYDKSLYR